MSWIKLAVYKAVEVGGNNTLTRTVFDYADTVVHHAGNAVAEGAKLLQGRRNFQSFRQTVKRLEEVSVSCRGLERVQLLRRWLVALKEIERTFAYENENNITGDDETSVFKTATLVHYYDPDLGDGPRNFRDVFLHSQALEGITLSMVNPKLYIKILERPNEEEVSLLLELYRLCLDGGSEVHNSVVSSIQDLAKAFSRYQEEVLVRREELLQFAKAAVSGLKLNADILRIDAEASTLKERLDKLPEHLPDVGQGQPAEETSVGTIEALEDVRTQVQLCSTMELLLLRKKSLRGVDFPEDHTDKIQKLKILSESLANSSSKAEKRIAENRYQKEEALSFRMAKTEEINQLEKEMSTQIRELEHQKDDLEASLKKVKASISAARARIQNAKEEREQFDEANNQFLVHLKSKEDELTRSLLAFRVESGVVTSWINFLQDTQSLENSFLEHNEKKVSGDLEKYSEYFVNLVVQLLPTYKEGLGSLMSSLKKLIEEFDTTPRVENPIIKDGKMIRPTKRIEEDYMYIEAKVSIILSIVETMKKQFFIQSEVIFRKDEHNVKEMLESIENLKHDIECLNRPTFKVDTPVVTPSSTMSNSYSKPFSIFTEEYGSVNKQRLKSTKVSSIGAKGKSPRLGSDQINLELELGETDSELSAKEIGEWEYDDLEKKVF